MLKVSNNLHTIQTTKKTPSFTGIKPIKLSEGVCRKLTKIGQNFNTPEQSLVIGATAMLFQPLIDLNNKKVDDKTRQAAASRSFSRAIIGTISGIAVRKGCIALGNKLTKEGAYCYLDKLKDLNPQQIKNYSKTVGNVLALGMLIFTNFLFDVPLINKMSNFINEKVFGHKPKEVKE